jgi:xanthine dehydrogenase YagS FAD-binding subunit
MKPFQVALPSTIDQASKLQLKDASPFMAAGTDLLARIKDYVTVPDTVIDLKRIDGISGITSDDRGLWIGALTRMHDVAVSEKIEQGYPALAETIRNAATPQIRNMATIGGNICQKPRCWYLRHEGYSCAKNGGSGCWAREGENEFHAIFDNQICAVTSPSNVAPVLVAYSALIEIQGGEEKREVPAEDFFITPDQDPGREVLLEPGEVVIAIQLPAKNRTRRWSYTEAREKQSFDWAQASVTILYDRGGRKGDHRVVLGAVSPAPLRRDDLEKILKSGSLDDAMIKKLQMKIGDGAHPLSQNGYKVPMLRGLIAQGVRNISGRKEG